MRTFRLFFCALISMASAHSFGEMTIDIVKPSANTTPIAIVPFANDSNSESLNSIIAQDLARSGLFKPADKFPETPSNSAGINFTVWQSANLDYVVVGTITPQANNQLSIQYELVSSSQQQRLLGESMTIPPARWRDAAHFISDRIFK